MEEVEPSLFLLFTDMNGEFGAEAYHPFLVGSSIGIVGIDGRGESFFGPVVFGNKVMVDEASSSSGV